MTPIKAGSEAAFQLQVENLADFYGWRFFHAPDNRPITAKSGRRYVQSVKAGFPDLVLSRGIELIVAELKTETGRVAKEQDAWLDSFRAFASALDDLVAGCDPLRPPLAPVFEVHVWRPSMVDEITQRLARPTIGVAGDELDQCGVCPNCELALVVPAPQTNRFSCRACGANWAGVRRRLAA